MVKSQKRIRTFTKVQERAIELRKSMTTAESLLWERLRGRRLGGFKFRRQHPLGPFIADFYCAVSHLVVEIDGDIHDWQVEQDQARTNQFELHGYRVIRFKNREVEENIQGVLSVILENCHGDNER